jgi:hypothetical protein
MTDWCRVEDEPQMTSHTRNVLGIMTVADHPPLHSVQRGFWRLMLVVCILIYLGALASAVYGLLGSVLQHFSIG